MPKSEREGIFVIKYKDYNGYSPYETEWAMPSLDINNAILFETRTKAYRYALDHGLDKKTFVEEVKI